MKKSDENTEQLAVSKKREHTHKVVLKIGNWRKQLDFNYIKTILAIALNYCCKSHELIINGYLITDQNLYLIIKTNEKSIDTIIKKIELQTILLLKINPKELKENKYEISFITDDENIIYTPHKSLFKIYPLQDEYLIKLITGKKITLPYYDRNLEDLKLMIHNHPFCSAIDYLGAIGPVHVTLLEN